MVTIIFTHPWHGSFNKAILDTITKKYDAQNTAYQVVDLNKDNFNPVMTGEDLSVYSKGQYKDPLVGKYQEILKSTDELVVIYPMWWMNVPAILKGFFDKVLLAGFSHTYENGWTPLLTNVKRVTVITTSEQATENFAASGDSVNDFIQNSLHSVGMGIGNTAWYNCDHTSHGSAEHRADFLKMITEKI